MSNFTTYTKRIALIMKTENNFILEKMIKFTQFCNFKRALGKTAFLKIAAQAFQDGDFEIFEV